MLGPQKYYLTDAKQIKVTQSFLELGQDTTECQDRESFEQCSSSALHEAARAECGCIAYSLRNYSAINVGIS